VSVTPGCTFKAAQRFFNVPEFVISAARNHCATPFAPRLGSFSAVLQVSAIARPSFRARIDFAGGKI
jgi:hypothetical protein